MKKWLSLGLVSILLILVTLPVFATPATQDMSCTEDYVVVADDWLSKLADKYYGNVLAYPSIVDATNAMAASDDSYATIENADVIEIGWKLCIPAGDDTAMMGSAMMDDSAMSDSAMTDDKAMDDTATMDDTTATDDTAMTEEATATEATEADPAMTEVDNVIVPPEGRGRVFLQNQYTNEYTIDISGQAVKVLPNTAAFDVYLDLNAGKHTFSISIPGEASGNGEIEVGANQSWVIILDENSNPLLGQIYPQ